MPSFPFIDYPSPLLLVAPFRDRDIYESIRELLILTGEFDEGAVRIGPSARQTRFQADDTAYANIQPSTDDVVQDGSTSREFHRCSFLLTFGVRASDDPETKYQSELDRIYAVIRNTIMSPANKTFSGRCLGPETKLTNGSISLGSNPNFERTIRGQFAYSISLVDSSYSTTA
jgi:hypothetical protein